MFWTGRLVALGLYLSTFLYKVQPFVLLTANVEDLKRIAQKFVSDSLADKIARFIIKAADNNTELDNSSGTKNLSEYNEDFDVEKKDIKPDYVGEFHQKSETNAKQQHKELKPDRSVVKTKPYIEQVHRGNKKLINKKKQFKSKNKIKKINKIAKEHSSMEYYRSEKQINQINPNSIIDLEKIHESDDSSATNVKQSRKEFNNLGSLEKTDEIQENTDNINSNIHKYIENDASGATGPKKDASDNLSEDLNYSNRLDTKSDELSMSKTNLTTEMERNEFDQYFNTNYPKAEVVATSGPLELTKSTKKDTSDTDYE